MKYGNRKAVVDGIAFDSKLEARRYGELKLLQRAGKIKGLILQPVFELLPTFKKNGKTYRAIKYIADFQYFDIGKDKIIIEDTKGFRTQIFAMKRKLFEYRYPDLEIMEVLK